LKELLESDQKFGFIVMDGNGALFGTLSGNTRTILHKIAVDLPKKHGRGGQSALRFARLRLEKRHNYLRKVAELSTQLFITNDKPNIAGLVLAGSAEFKSKLNTSEMFDNRLAPLVIKVVDVSYGGENGFNQAIELSTDALSNVKFVKEKKLLAKYFAEISQDTGKYCFGPKDTMHALESGAVEELIVYENLTLNRYVLFNSVTNEEKVLILNEKQEKQSELFFDKANNVELDIKDKQPLLEWLANNFKNFGTSLNFVTNKSPEGSQFCKGFGGIGGLLRYQVDFAQIEENDDDDENPF
jgi:peptide chain release factor subunit 1